jgi:hypothetical protein
MGDIEVANEIEGSALEVKMVAPEVAVAGLPFEVRLPLPDYLQSSDVS